MENQNEKAFAISDSLDKEKRFDLLKLYYGVTYVQYLEGDTTITEIDKKMLKRYADMCMEKELYDKARKAYSLLGDEKKERECLKKIMQYINEKLENGEGEYNGSSGSGIKK